jgi:hypothetical protein
VTPCDRCQKRVRCETELLACRALLLFTRGASMERVRYVPRQPTVEYMTQLSEPAPKLKRLRARPTELADLWGDEDAE